MLLSWVRRIWLFSKTWFGHIFTLRRNSCHRFCLFFLSWSIKRYLSLGKDVDFHFHCVLYVLFLYRWVLLRRVVCQIDLGNNYLRHCNTSTLVVLSWLLMTHSLVIFVLLDSDSVHALRFSLSFWLTSRSFSIYCLDCIVLLLSQHIFLHNDVWWVSSTAENQFGLIFLLHLLLLLRNS